MLVIICFAFITRIIKNYISVHLLCGLGSQRSTQVIFSPSYPRIASNMTAERVRQLEEKISQYEDIMRKCPQCRNHLSSEEAEPTIVPSDLPQPSDSSRHSRAEMPPPLSLRSSKRNEAASQLSSSPRKSTRLALVHQPPTSFSSLEVKSTVSPKTQRLRPSESSNQSNVETMRSSSAVKTRQPARSKELPSKSSTPHGRSTGRGNTNETANLVLPEPVNPTAKPKHNRTGRKPTNDSRQAYWISTAEMMLKEVPLGRDWEDRLSMMDETIFDAVKTISTSTPQTAIGPTDEVEKSEELIRVVRRFAHRHSVMRTNFQQLLLVCLCNVLLYQGVPQDRIIGILQICISNSSKENVELYLKGATWINQLLDELFFNGWGYRAVELVAICMYISSVGALIFAINRHTQGIFQSPRTPSSARHLIAAIIFSYHWYKHRILRITTKRLLRPIMIRYPGL